MRAPATALHRTAKSTRPHCSTGPDSGAAQNYDAVVDQPYQFDFYDGGGLDLAFLSFVEVDPEGNVNISRFGGKIVGIGGFINISQNAKHVVFSGTFTAGGLEVAFADGGLKIKEQVTYSAPFAAKEGRTAIFVTERAVLKSAGGTLEVMEIAPGSDLERDVLRHMAFKPRIAKNLRLMDKHLFDAAPMNLRADLEAKARSVTRGAGFFRRAG